MVSTACLNITLYVHCPSHHHVFVLVTPWKREQTCIFYTLLRLTCHIIGAHRGDAQCRDQVIDAQASPPWPYILKIFLSITLASRALTSRVVAFSFTWIMATGLYSPFALFRKTFERPILYPRNRSLGRHSQIINSKQIPTRDRLKRRKNRTITRIRIRSLVCTSFTALVSSLHVVARTVLPFPLFTLPLFFGNNSRTLSNYLTQRPS